jgi:hypothetical protein
VRVDYQPFRVEKHTDYACQTVYLETDQFLAQIVKLTVVKKTIAKTPANVYMYIERGISFATVHGVLNRMVEAIQFYPDSDAALYLRVGGQYLWENRPMRVAAVTQMVSAKRFEAHGFQFLVRSVKCVIFICSVIS